MCSIAGARFLVLRSFGGTIVSRKDEDLACFRGSDISHRGTLAPGPHPVRTMPKRFETVIVIPVTRKPSSAHEETGTYIGPPRRIYIVEPLENPVPAKRPLRAPKAPAQPRPERVREPEVPAQ
jgi:hypothetical protein